METALISSNISKEAHRVHMKTDPIFSLEHLNAAPLPPDAELSLQRNNVFLPSDVQSALNLVLASKAFFKAKRTSRLLGFLVEKSLSGEVRETSEYAIGIGVFDRDPATYRTDHDPIVRVQIGRLREKLKAHYAAEGVHTDLMFVIPLGSYMPLIHKHSIPDAIFQSDSLLTVVPMLHLSDSTQGAAFTSGFTEELTFQLFKIFGTRIMSHTFLDTTAPMSPKIHYRLEGSIRFQDGFIRAALRLIDTPGCIAWSEQFDRCGPLLIAVQEELALEICHALKRHFLKD